MPEGILMARQGLQALVVDKAWETSLTRRTLIAFFTYLAIGIYFWAIGIQSPWLNAVVPTAAFLLSTLTLPYLKDAWMKRRKN